MIVGVVIVYSFLLGILSNFPLAELGGAVFADVTSANVVGYNTLDMNMQYTMLGNSFGTVGQEGLGKLYLKDIKGEFTDEDEIQVSFMNGYMIDFTIYTYYTENYGYDPEGWYDGQGNYVGDSVYIEQGQAAWLKIASGERVPATISGEVAGQEITLNNFTKTYEMVVNPYPVAFNPNDTENVTWSGTTDEDEIQVSFMNGYMIDFTIYTYYTENYGYDPEGWYDGQGNYISTPVAAVGQGWWLKTADPSSVTLTIKNPAK